MINLIIYFFSFFLILISILGYGILLQNNFKVLNRDNCFGYTGLAGIFFYLFYSYLSNFFLAHDKIHNIFFLIIGILIFFYFYKHKFNQETSKTLIIFLIIFISILVFKSHDDFAYYHFPYSYHLTEQKMVIGIGQILQGFRTPSSIFYFNSLLYLPLVEYSLFNFFPAYILGFANLILIKKIFKSKKNFNLNNYLSLIIFIFINIFFIE